jgi:hypothetical protein
MLDACCVFGLDARHRVIACAPRPDGDVPAGCCPLPLDGESARPRA